MTMFRIVFELKSRPLLKECVQALGNNVSLLSRKESENIFAVLEQVVPVGFSSIDWQRVSTQYSIETESSEEIISILTRIYGKNNFNNGVYILYDCAGVPVMQTSLQSALEHIDDVTSVCPKLWFFATDFTYVVEWLIDRTTLGIVDSADRLKGKKFEAFLTALGDEVTILSRDQSADAFKFLKNKYGFKDSLVAWSMIPNKISIDSKEELLPAMQRLIPGSSSSDVFLLWNNESLPVLETHLAKGLYNISLALEVCNDIFILHKNAEYIMEINNNTLLLGTPPVERFKKGIMV